MLFFIVFICSLPAFAAEASKEKSIQHFKVEDVTTIEKAKYIFIRSSSEIKNKTIFNSQELEQIHIITYSLEKSVLYFIKNLQGERQSLAQEIAIIVEDIHINSENNRPQATKLYINKYFHLADKFMLGFSSLH